MNFFTSFDELIECEVKGKAIDLKQIKYLSRFLINSRDSVTY